MSQWDLPTSKGGLPRERLSETIKLEYDLPFLSYRAGKLSIEIGTSDFES